MRLAGLLHDVGNIAISNMLLEKPDPLDAEEWVEIRRHSEIGARILANARLGDIGQWVLAHHERVDGGGFPFGLSNGEIPLEARILAVADAFEAMTSERPLQGCAVAGRGASRSCGATRERSSTPNVVGRARSRALLATTLTANPSCSTARESA